MFGLLITLAVQGVLLVVRLIVFLALLAVRLGLILFATVFALAGAIYAFASRRRGGRGPDFSRKAIDPELRWAVFRRDGYACLYCGSEYDLSVDHVYPVSRGGGNEPDNLQTLCRDCNSRKGALV